MLPSSSSHAVALSISNACNIADTFDLPISDMTTGELLERYLMARAHSLISFDVRYVESTTADRLDRSSRTRRFLDPIAQLPSASIDRDRLPVFLDCLHTTIACGLYSRIKAVLIYLTCLTKYEKSFRKYCFPIFISNSVCSSLL